MKRNKKITLIAMSVLLVMTLAATVISFSLANNKSQKDKDSLEQLLADNDPIQTKTIIDYIIEKSWEDPATTSNYRVVEIGSSKDPYSDLGRFASPTDASTSDFKDYVIDGHKTIDQFMKAHRIDYKYYWVGDVDATAMEYINGADFVYVSVNPANGKAYSATNDLGEKLYDFLHSYAVGDYKPLVIDSPTKYNETDEGEGYSIPVLVANYLAKLGYKYRTYDWPASMDSAQANATLTARFLEAGLDTDSLYVAINGKSRQANWTKVKPKDSTQKTASYMSEILVISSSTTGDSALTNRNSRVGKLTVNSDAPGDIVGYEDEVEITPAANQKILNISKAPFYSFGYSSRYVRPVYSRLTQVNVEDVANIDFDAYDIVVLEDDLEGLDISETAFKTITAAMYANTQMIFGEVLGTASSGGSQPQDFTGTNYKKLFDMVANENEVAYYTNIMVTNKAEFSIILNSKSVSTCKKIADLINGSSFRGIGGPSSSASTFTVLEVQPCYPIDEVVAKNNSGYYTKPAQMINGKTKEQIGDITDSRNIEYYAWEISEAKIAQALNMNANQVKVVHMSSEELATSKTEILGTYDMVYIGGNTTALKDATEWNSIVGLTYDQWVRIGTKISAANLLKLPIYTMYSHDWDIIQLGPFSCWSNRGGGPIRTGETRYLSSLAKGQQNKAFTTLAGNDITYNQLQAFEKYVAAGMPIVVSNKVSDSFNTIEKLKQKNESPFLQNSIDPESNMYKLLDYCNEITKEAKAAGLAGADNIVWDFDANDVVSIDNDGGRLGDTAVGTVEVFADSDGDYKSSAFYKTFSESSKRPKLTLTSMPAIYSEYDKATRIDVNDDLVFEFEVTGSTSYTVNLYADYDLNSVFTDDELIETAEDVTRLTTCLADHENEGYGPEYYGPVYWKLELVDNSSEGIGTVVSTTNICYITNTDIKGQINVLQILPENGASSYVDAEGLLGCDSLIFCTECERSREIMEYNPGCDTVPESYRSAYNGGISQSMLGPGHTFQGIYVGKHKHDFGIVKYESGLQIPQEDDYGSDNWDTNFADDVADLYDFDIDIMTTRTLEARNTAVVNGANTAFTNYKTWYVNYWTSNQIGNTDIDGKWSAAQLQEFLAFVDKSEAEVKKMSLVDLQTYITLFNADCIEKVKAMTPVTAKEGLSDEQKAEFKNYLIDLSNDYSDEVDTTELDMKTEEAALRKTLEGIGAKTTSAKVKRYVDQVLNNERYADYILEMQPINIQYEGEQDWYYTEFKTAYEKYARAKDAYIDAVDAYKLSCQVASYDNWLLGQYSCVIIGPSEDFGGDDINDAGTLATLTNYVKSNGSVFLFHETLAVFGDRGSTNLTNALQDAFGNDSKHMEEDASKMVDQSITYEKTSVYPKDISYSIRIFDEKGDELKYFNQYSDNDLGTINPKTETMTYKFTQDFVKGLWGVEKNNWTQDVKASGTIDVGAIGININIQGTRKYAIAKPNGYEVDHYDTFTSYEGCKVQLTIKNNDWVSGNWGDKVTVFEGTVDANGNVKFGKTVPIKNWKTETITDVYPASDIYYTPYKVRDGYDANVYFTTNISHRTGDEKYSAWAKDMTSFYGDYKGNYYKYYSVSNYTNTILYGAINSASQVGGDITKSNGPYKYGVYNHGQASNYSLTPCDRDNLGSTYADQSNLGIVTLYPFTLSSRLKIAGTHAASYAVDLEDEDMSVLYTLSGGDGKSNFETSSVFAASPKDGHDSYFIYSYKSVTYCGAGHNEVTGPKKDNNDERRLYINIICNTATNKPKSSLNIYDYGTTENKIIKKAKAADYDYLYEIDPGDEYPEFSFLLKLGLGATLRDCKAYYDYDASKTFNAGDAIITQYGSDMRVGRRIDVGYTDDTETAFIATLKMDPTKLTNGTYTYIVVEATDSSGKKIRKRIKVSIKPELFNLT